MNITKHNLFDSSKILAKTFEGAKETLEEHNNKLIDALEVLIDLFDDKHKIRKDLLWLAIEFHDIGKAESSWLDNKIKSNCPLTIRHEVLSFLVAAKYIKGLNLSNHESLMILMPILLHHNKFIDWEENCRLSNPNEDDDTVELSTMLLSNQVNIKWMDGVSDSRIFSSIERQYNQHGNSYIINQVKNTITRLSKGITKEQSFDIQYHCSLLCAADQLASGGYSQDEIRKFFDIDYTISAASDTLTPRPYQQYVIDAMGETTSVMVMDFRPGAGKTLVTEFIAKKLNRTIIHGTPKNIISDDLAWKGIGTKVINLDDFGDPENPEFKKVRQKNSWFRQMSPRLYTTPDNIFLMSQGYKRHFLFLRALYNGLIIIDEFHDCVTDNNRRHNLYHMIEKFLYFNIPVILMSGTTPNMFVEKLKHLCNESGKDFQYISDEGCKVNHSANGCSVNVNIPLTNVNKGTISFYDGDPDRRIVSGLPWWNGDNFEAGYFFAIKDLLDGYVEKGESVAVCFSSKKTIYQFIHMFNTFSDYEFNKDYAVICSPGMTDESVYRPILNKALGELKKGSKESDRTFKFVLCTSYTEMGVDFSVRRMIIESSFIHNIEQQLGRMNRWNEFGSDASCVIFPAFTRYTVEETNYRRIRYGSEDNYNNLLSLYSTKNPVSFDFLWYTKQELNENFRWVIRNVDIPEWEYINVCGVYRSSKEQTGVNGMYRHSEGVLYTWGKNNVEYTIPPYRINQDEELNITPHPLLFI